MTARVDTKAVRARAEAATPGPWDWNDSRVFSRSEGYDGPTHALVDRRWPNSDNDIAFITNARADVPQLCDRVEALESECAAHVLYIADVDAKVMALEAAITQALTELPIIEGLSHRRTRMNALVETLRAALGVPEEP